MQVQKLGIRPACILDAAVGMANDASRFWLAIRNGRPQCFDCQACFEVRIQSLDDDLAAECMQDGKECKLLGQMQVGDVRNPKLMELR